jgi:hypothetical protein
VTQHASERAAVGRHHRIQEPLARSEQPPRCLLRLRRSPRWLQSSPTTGHLRPVAPIHSKQPR